MARPIRIQYAGAVYHVMARGSHGQVVFQDNTDRKVFLETLGEACEKTGWRIHAYVLMGNHYH
jgi:REP element-mobilizing transposase RayT